MQQRRRSKRGSVGSRGAARGVLLLAGWLLSASVPADTPAAFRLDVENGVGGIPFEAPLPPGFKQASWAIGKRWHTTRVYTRPDDTTRLHGLGVPATYWFRQGRFEGVQLDFASEKEVPRLLAQLTALYGPARPDTVATDWYWLGQRSFVLLERHYPHGAMVELASLDMLNEQVYELAVRARARRQLGWRPDSAGLLRQFPAQDVIRYGQRRAKKEGK